LDFVDPREHAAESRKRTREAEEKKRKQKQIDRREERGKLRYELSLEETFVFDLLDELDQENITSDDPRLEELANLAPETFTKKVVEHLLPAVLKALYQRFPGHMVKQLYAPIRNLPATNSHWLSVSRSRL